MNTILIVGDSYTYGQGCDDRIYYYDPAQGKHLGEYFEYPKDPASRYCWASLLKDNLPDYNVVNLASPGNSQFGIFKDMTDYINANNDVVLILFNATFFNRISIASYGNPDLINPWSPSWYTDPDKEVNPLQPKEYRDAKNAYVKYLMNDSILQYQSIMSTLGANSLATNKNIKFLWSTPEQEELNSLLIYQSLHSIEQSRFTHVARYDFSGVKDFRINWDNYHFKDNHTNTAGHKMYFEKELFPLVKRTLNIA
jgi:hypothetical protein